MPGYVRIICTCPSKNAGTALVVNSVICTNGWLSLFVIAFPSLSFIISYFTASFIKYVSYIPVSLLNAFISPLSIYFISTSINSRAVSLVISSSLPSIP